VSRMKKCGRLALSRMPFARHGVIRFIHVRNQRQTIILFTAKSNTGLCLFDRVVQGSDQAVDHGMLDFHYID
jgi:hypothetical protein